LQHPRLHELFGIADRIGLTSLLIGDATTVEALQPVPELESLVVLPAGPRPPNPSELLTSPQFGKVIGRLRDSGVTVVIDSPPVLEGSEGMVVAAASNAAVLVTSVRTGSGRRLRRALALLDRAGAPYVGVVLNRAGKEAGGYRDRSPRSEAPAANGGLRRVEQWSSATSANGKGAHEGIAGEIGVDSAH